MTSRSLAVALFALCSCTAMSCTNGSSSNGTWTSVTPLNGPAIQAQTASGLLFTSPSSGVVSFADGLVEHFASATSIDRIALDGTGKLAGGDDAYFGFIAGTPLGLVVRDSSAKNLIVSTDHGASFTYTPMYGTVSGAPPTVSPEFPLLWLGLDPSNTWHVAVTAGPGGDVYASASAPGATATLEDTWHPDGDITVPATLGSADCDEFIVNGVDPDQVLQVFGATTDASAMTYSSSSAICHSTDGGNSFIDVSANITPASFTASTTPELYLFTSPTVGIAVYGNALDNPGSEYVLYTTDGGTSWTQGTLPPLAMNNGLSLLGVFASPSGTMYIAGGDDGLVLFRSADGGKTWSDLSENLAPWASGLGNAPLRLSAGFALDDEHIWIGGDNGFLAYSATGGQ